MPKHKKWRKSFKSSFVHHIDPEKANELKGTKTEIDGKVEKILNILKEGDGNNRKDPVVVDLIEEFNNHYQSLYASYENLTEELRKKAHGYHKNSSSSSSSDSSDSDESSNKKGKKNGKVKINFETDTAVVKQELEMALLEVGDLKRKLAATEDEKEALYLEYQAEGEKSNEEKSKLLAENAEINIELGSLRKVQAELNQRLEDVEKERESLIADKEAVFFNAEELRTINSELQHEKKNLHLELESVNGLLSTLKQDYESLKNEVVKLSQMQKTAEEENFKFSSKISHLENEIELAENKNRDLVTESRRLSEELAEKEIELSRHLEIHEAYKEEASARIKDLELQILHKENEASTKIEDLVDQINAKDKELEDQMSSKITEVNQLREEKCGLENKISELEKSLAEKRDDFVAIEKEMEEVRSNASIQIAALTEQVKSSENKINEMTDQFQKDIDAKNQEIYQLEDNIDELKTDLEMKVDEVSRLVDNMRTTEVKQRLTSQKLRITEQLLGENEECQLRRVEKLQYDQKLLEEKIAVLSRMNAAYKEAQANVAAEISEKVNSTLTGMDTFGMKFEEDYGHLESRVYEIMNELKFTRNWIVGTNAEKRSLKDEISGLIQQLKDEKEKGLKLTVKITELENVVKKGEDEIKSLTQSAEKRGEKMRELEREMKEKDNGILRLCEEKREAIRQLCVSIDYHQNRYEDLREMILIKRGGRRHVAT
ncbi:hypothetical protein ABFS82_01G064700 [Erythranthe guttata]